MRSPRYALEAVARLREELVDAAARKLASAISVRSAAEQRRARADQERLASEAAAARVREGERQALARGELRVADLAHGSTWEVRASVERTAREAEVVRARDAEASAREAEQGLRGEVAARQADSDVVAKDRARWQQQQRKRAEAKEEELAAEARRPKPA